MIIVSNAATTDRGITSSNNTYSTALNGSGLSVTNETYALVGQARNANGTFFVRQYFVQFGYTLPAGQIPVAGHFFFRNTASYGTSINRNLELRKYDWGTSVATSNFRTPSQLSALDLSGVNQLAGQNGSNRDLFLGARRILGDFNSSATLRFVLASSRNRLQNTPAMDTSEHNNISQTGHATAANRPRMVIGTTTENMMHPVLAAQVQLSDGSWIVAEKPNMNRATFKLQLRRVLVNGSSNIIWESGEYNFNSNDNFRGTHVVALARDPQDNIYLCDGTFESIGQLSLKVATNNNNGTWTMRPNRTIDLPDEDGSSNTQAVQMTYHDIGTGRLVIMAFRDWGVQGGTQCPYALVDASRLASHSTGLVLDMGRGGERGFIAYPANPGRWNPINSTGTLFDMHADPFNNNTGWIVAGERHAVLGSNSSVSIGRYRIHSNGNQFNSSTWSFLDTNGGFSTYDPDAKARVVATDSQGSFAKITADSRSDVGLTVDLFNMPQNSNSSVRFNSIRFGSIPAVSTMPAAASMAASMTWDAVYFPPDNSVWVYYLDKDNPRRLMRTAVRVGTKQAQQNQVQVVAELAPSGHTIQAIRVQRNRSVSDQILITAASVDGSSNHHYQYHIDRINVPPTQPILNVVPNYNATAARTFSWTFQDPNITDSQSAYELQVINADTSAVVVDTGKVTSSTSSRNIAGGTIPNNANYLWRVRVWDSVDEVSAWSDYSPFTTSSSGTVTITDPTIDNDPNIFTEDYLVKWSVAGAGQDSYRIILTRTLDNSVFHDTNWISSTATQHLVPLETDVEYLLTVRVRASLVESVPGTRLITTHYSTSEKPIVSLQNHVEYINVSVTNPEPRGDRPAPTVNRIYRRLAGTAGPFIYVGSCEPDGTFQDYTVASNTIYEYKVRTGVES